MVDVVEVNVKVNDLVGCVICLEVVGFGYVDFLVKVFFDLVFVNILKVFLVMLVFDMGKNIVVKGYVILLGIFNE